MVRMEDLKSVSKPPQDPEFLGEELIIENDVAEAFTILEKIVKFLDYLSDFDLCDGFGRKERRIAARLSKKAGEFLTETQEHYEG